MKLNKRVTVRLTEEQYEFLGKENLAANIRASLDFLMQMAANLDKVQPQQSQLTEAELINKFIPETPEDKNSGELVWS